MPVFTVTVANTDYDINIANNTLLEGIDTARMLKNGDLDSSNSNFISTKHDYLNFVLNNWAIGKPTPISNNDIQTITTQAIYSWAGLPNPNDVIEQPTANTDPIPVVIGKSGLIKYANLKHKSILGRTDVLLVGINIDTTVDRTF